MLKRLSESYVCQPTEKQREIMKNLGVGEEEANSVISARNAIYNKIQENGNVELSYPQRMKMLTSFSLLQIRQILKREITNINEITKNDYYRCMKVMFDSNKLFLRSHNHPLKITNFYEFGWQESNIGVNGRLYYIVSYNILMVDVDGVDIDLQKIETLGMTGRVYRTYNGYHLFITSQYINYRDHRTIDHINNVMQGDLFYNLFCKKYGYKVRISAKIDREQDIIAEYVGKFGQQPEIPKILEYLEVHDHLISKVNAAGYKDEYQSGSTSEHEEV